MIGGRRYFPRNGKYAAPAPAIGKADTPPHRPLFPTVPRCMQRGFMGNYAGGIFLFSLLRIAIIT